MKTILTALAAIWLSIGVAHASAEITYKAEIDVDKISGLVSGKVTMSGSQDAHLYIYNFHDLKLDGKQVSPAETMNMPLADGKPHVLEYKREKNNSDIINEDFISFSSLSPLPLAGVSVDKTFTIALPAGFEAVGEAENISKTKGKNSENIFTFKMDKPLNSFDVIASKKYAVKNGKVADVEVYVYFFKDNADLSDKYLQKTIGYIKMYEELFKSKFPYKRFSVVEHVSPYGYATPTYTVLGSQVLRLPFIPDTSLGHEVLHQWFGCAIDGKDGDNWFEAMAVYFADMYYLDIPEQEAYRKNIMINYDIYSGDNRTYPLENFQFNNSRLSQTIGYGKGAMVFHMLEGRLGKEKFYEGIRKLIKDYQFKNASWKDVFNSFSGEDLEEFAKIMLTEKESPSFKVSGARYLVENGQIYVSFDLTRTGGEEKMGVPYTIFYDNGKEEGMLLSLKTAQSFKIPVKSGSVKFVIDSDYDIMRKLTAEETPPVLNHIFETEKVIAIKDDNNSCDQFFMGLNNIEKIKDSKDVTFADVAENNLVICGLDNVVARGLIGAKANNEKGISQFQVVKNFKAHDKYAMIVDNPAIVNSHSVKRYGKYSRVAFDGGKNILKEIEPTDSGITVLSRQEDKGVEPTVMKTLSEIVAIGKKYPAIFIGEQHTNYAHHINQLEVIKKLNENGVKVAVGFEMIQKQFQSALDDFVSGKIDEREFLKKTEYFDRWSYDYNLYAPIFRYLRDNKIDGIALNIDGVINKKVSSGNMAALTDQEKEQLPKEMKLDNPKYAKEIGDIFRMHAPGKEFDKKFNDFFLAQNVWDEVMAESAANYQKKNPDKTLVIIAGNGHSRKDSGIPLRYARLTGKEGFVILQDEEADKTKADITLFTSEIEGEESPKIGITITENNGEVTIESVDKDSPAGKAGIKAKDKLMRCASYPITSIGDLKYSLFQAGYGAELKCEIKRNKKVESITVKLEKFTPDKAGAMEQMMKMMGKKP